MASRLRNFAQSLKKNTLDKTDLDERAIDFFRPQTGILATGGRNFASKVLQPVERQLQKTTLDDKFVSGVNRLKETKNPLIQLPQQFAGGMISGSNFGIGGSPNRKPQNLSESLAFNTGSVVGSLNPKALTARTIGLFNKATNPLVRKAIKPFAGVASSRIASGGANVAQGLALDKTLGNQTTPLSVGFDAVTGALLGPNQFDDALKPIGKGFGTGRNKYIPWHPEDTNKLDQLTDFVNTNKKIDIETANQLDIEYSRLADGYLPKKTVTDLAQKYSKNPRKYFIELSKELQKSFRRVGEEDTFNLPKLGLVGDKKFRGFPETVTKTQGTPEFVKTTAKQSPSNYYSPLSNKTVVRRVSKLINKNEEEALRLARTGRDSVQANATAMLLIDKYNKTGQHEKAAQLIEEVSPRFTSQGQQIQILSLYGRLTPTGAQRFTQRLIDKANAQNKNLNLKLSPESAKEIADKANQIQKLPEGSREKIIATAELMEKMKSQVPATWGQRISTIQTMAQLLNPKTAIRNILGNSLFTVFENASDVVGTPIDFFTSLATGKRAKTLPSIKAQGKGFVKGAREGLEDALKGIDTSGGADTKFDLPQKTFNDPVFGNLEKLLNIELRVPDRAAYQAAFEGSLNNQMRALEVNKPTQDMLEIAHADALYRTFQDESVLAKVFSGAKRLLNKIGVNNGAFGLGDLVLKYPKTPANLLQRGLDYSPAGFVNTIYQLVKPALGKEFDQKKFVETFARSLTGTGLIATGYILAENGVISGKPEKDLDIALTQRAVGKGDFRFNVSALKRFFYSGFQPQEDQVDDVLVSYDWAQPNALQLSMGADIAKGGNNQSKINTVLEGISTGSETLTQQPLVSGLTDFFTTAGDPNRGGVVRATQDAVLSTPGSFTPSLLNQIGQLTDNTSRNSYDPNPFKQSLNRVTQRIPVLRTKLEPRINVLGEKQEQFQGESNNLFNVFLNPAFVSKVKDNPGAKEVLEIFEKSGETQQAPRYARKKVKINGENRQLTPQEYTNYQQYIGTKTNEIFNQLAQNQSFVQLSDEDKAKEMSQILTDINTAAKVELFGADIKNASTRSKSFITQDGSQNTPVLYLKDDSGAIKEISTNFNPPILKLTGNKSLDKKLLSEYKSSITKKQNDIVTLYENGYISSEKADQLISNLEQQKKGSGKGKKAKISGGGGISIKQIPRSRIKLSSARSNPQLRLSQAPRTNLSLAKSKSLQPNFKIRQIQKPKIRISA